MQPAIQVIAASKKIIWTGRILSALPVLLMLATGMFGLLSPAAAEGVVRYGYPQGAAVPICLLEIACAIIYAIPRTSVLGAILLTAYLGGATATHVRVGEAFFIPVITGVVVWAGVFLREERLRALLPLRT